MAALAGANLIYGLGMIESGQTLDYGQLVMDNEFAQMIKQVLAGIRVDDTTLAVDVIHEIGPFGDFLSCEDTYRHMRGQSEPTRYSSCFPVAELRLSRLAGSSRSNVCGIGSPSAICG